MLDRVLRTFPAFALVIVFYLFAAWQPRQENPMYRNSYDLVVDAWLHGQTHLRLQLDPVFLNDPHAFRERAKYIVQRGIIDLSVYQGKVYSYFGVGPVATLYVPFKVLTGRDLPDPVAVLLFGFGSFLFGALSLLKVRARYAPAAPLWAAETSVIVLGFCNLVPPLLKYSHVYEVAVAAGMFYLMGALYFGISAFGGERPRTLFLASSSLMAGLSAACRPHYALVAAAWWAGCAWHLSRRAMPGAERWKHLAALSFPMAAIGALLAWHNLIRFGDILEFGATYQVSPLNPGGVGTLFDPARIPLGLYFYLFNPPAIMDKLPFLQISKQFPAFYKWPAGTYVLDGGTIGLFPNVPFTWVALMAPMLYAQSKELFWGRRGCLAASLVWTAYYFVGLQVAAALLGGFGSWTSVSVALRAIEQVQMEVPLAFVWGACLWACCVFRGRPFGAPGGLLFAGTPVLMLVPLLSAHQSVNFRYPADFTGVAVLVTGWIWMETDMRLAQDPVRRNFLRAAAVSLALLSAAIGWGHSLNLFPAY